MSPWRLSLAPDRLLTTSDFSASCLRSVSTVSSATTILSFITPCVLSRSWRRPFRSHAGLLVEPFFTGLPLAVLVVAVLPVAVLAVVVVRARGAPVVDELALRLAALGSAVRVPLGLTRLVPAAAVVGRLLAVFSLAVVVDFVGRVRRASDADVIFRRVVVVVAPPLVDMPSTPAESPLPFSSVLQLLALHEQEHAQTTP
mmetsp:Transcript_15755/g.61540  ORF Transcript_15755/g.61540 Transcript_15755/m.61540 type:complete len:200 (-) Transcript_15755:10-609(-)